MCINTYTSPVTGEPTILEDKSMDGRPSLLTKAPLCQARNRLGKSCRCPAVRGRRVCRMHGGLSPGAPVGERNGQWRHGGWSNEAVALRREVSALVRQVREAL